MKNLGKIRSTNRPQDIEMTENSVFVASNITEYNKNIDGYIEEGYEYDCIEYTKDEYLLSLAQQLTAAKILLGVD